MKKIDIFNHIWPKPFFDALIAHIGEMTDITMRSGAVPMMTDLDRRFEVMDKFGEDYQQVLSLASPPLEKLAGPEKALELSKIGSDSMAELCQKYPERFPGFHRHRADEQSRRAGRGMPPRDRGSGRRRHADLHQHRRQPGRPAGIRAVLRIYGEGRQAGLAAPGARREFRRLQEREPVRIRDLVDLRLALRDLGRDGAHGLLALLRQVRRG